MIKKGKGMLIQLKNVKRSIDDLERKKATADPEKFEIHMMRLRELNRVLAGVTPERGIDDLIWQAFYDLLESIYKYNKQRYRLLNAAEKASMDIDQERLEDIIYELTSKKDEDVSRPLSKAVLFITMKAAVLD